MLSTNVEAQTLADWRASQENVCAKLEGNRPIFAIYVYINT